MTNDDKHIINTDTLKALIAKVVDFSVKYGENFVNSVFDIVSSDKVGELVDEYGQGFVTSVFSIVSTDKIKEINESTILHIIHETLFHYEMSKQDLLGKDHSNTKKYARIVIIKLIKTNLPCYSYENIMELLNLGTESNVRQIFKNSNELSTRIKDENFAINVIEKINKSIKQLKDKQLKLAKTTI